MRPALAPFSPSLRRFSRREARRRSYWRGWTKACKASPADEAIQTPSRVRLSATFLPDSGPANFAPAALAGPRRKCHSDSEERNDENRSQDDDLGSGGPWLCIGSRVQ